MPGFFSRACKGLLLVALVAYTLVQDVIPAFTAVTDDFPTYFTSAKMVREGQDAAKLYDGLWFREQMRRYGLGHPERCRSSFLLIHHRRRCSWCRSRACSR